jgi:hypothetical protein
MNRFQQYEFPRFPFYMRENAISWFGIDEDHKDYWPKYFKKHPYVVDEDPWGKKNKNKKKGGNKGGLKEGQLQKGQGQGKGKGKSKSKGKGKEN